MSAKSSACQRLGNLVSFQTNGPSLFAETTFAKFRITEYTPSILRITLTQSDDFDDFSYSVVSTPLPGKMVAQDFGENLLIKTSALHLVIEKKPVRFIFQTPDGRIINEEDPLATSWIGEQVSTYKKLQEGERFIGLGEKTGHLDRRGSALQNWNTDAYAFNAGTDPLYSSIPFYMGLHHELCYGIFLDNTHKSFFNFGASNNRFSSFSVDAGDLNYYFIFGHSVRDVIQHYTELTGRMELPPAWSIGYQQCRYSYYPDKEVLNVARTFREKEIPGDAIVLDIHYMDHYKIFTWDSKKFSDPAGMIDTLKKAGFHVVIMCDPGIKVEKGYETYDDGLSNDVFLKYPDGENYTGQVWPGWCHFPDFTNPKTRSWWAGKFADYVNLGVEGFWNDMNEIATWGNALPENIEFDYDGHKATMRKGRNVFGFQMARSTYEGTKKLMKGKRPFNLTRSGFAGVQRYSALWTGDNVAYDEHMMLGIRMVNCLGLSGVAFAGYDAGGFVGDANKNLFARWMSIAALSPFFRSHAMINSRDSEPWSYGEEVESICRNIIRFRYQLMPYIYSVFHEAVETGLPIQRSLTIDYAHQHQVYNRAYEHQYLFGPSVLVAPVESHKEITKVFLPVGEWYYLYTGKVYAGDQEIFIECPIHKLPVFIKAGTVLPMQRPVMNTSETIDELILHVYSGSQPSEFNFFTDDGETFAYQQGESARRKIEYLPNENKLILHPTKGTFKVSYTMLKLIFHGLQPDAISHHGERRELHPYAHTFFSPLEKYDPINQPDSMGEEWVKTCTLNYSAEKMEVNW
jgi:alpha-glucosidase